MASKKLRLDQLLVERGIYPDAQAALRAVLAREVKVGDEYATSAAMKVAVTGALCFWETPPPRKLGTSP